MAEGDADACVIADPDSCAIAEDDPASCAMAQDDDELADPLGVPAGDRALLPPLQAATPASSGPTRATINDLLAGMNGSLVANGLTAG